MGEVHGFEQWSCPECVAEEETLFSREGEPEYSENEEDWRDETECPYCGAVAEEVNRNQYNVLFECPGCGYITSTEIESIRKRNEGL